MLAIVIPYFKIDFFEETLASLTQQTNKNFKVYIGDDASPESPLQLLEKYRGLFNYSYHRFQRNLGGMSLTRQWGRCIAMVQDEKWIMVLGDDDVLEKNVISQWYKHYKVFNNKSNVVRFATKMIYENSTNKSEKFTHPIWEKSEDAYYRKFISLTRSSLSEYIFLKENYFQFKFYDYPLGWYSDDRAWLEFSNDKPIYTINDAVVIIRNSSINISGKIDNIEEKKNARHQFLKFVIYNKLYKFNKAQRIELIRAYELITLSIRKFTIREWLTLLQLHLNNFSIASFKKFLELYLHSNLKPIFRE